MGGKIRVLKDVGGGLRGSTSGLRFNPREAPEFAEEDRNFGQDDPKSKQLEDEKKRKEREDRHKKIAGLHHLNVKIPKKKKKRAKGDNARNDEELSEMTGPASSTGYPLDVATGAKTGGGSAMGGPNIMTGEIMSSVMGDIFLKRDISRNRQGIPTIESKTRSERGKRSRTRRKRIGHDVMSARHASSPALNVHGARNQPKSGTRIRHGRQKRTLTTKGLPLNPTLTNSTHRSGKNLLWLQANPQKRLQKTFRSGASKLGMPGLPYLIPTVFGAAGGFGSGSKKAFGSLKKSRGTKPRKLPSTPRGSRKPGVPGGMHGIRGTQYGSGFSSFIKPLKDAGSAIASIPGAIADAGSGLAQSFSGGASPIVASDDDYDSLFEERILKTIPKLSNADLTEFKQLVRELRRLLRSGGLKKAGLEDAEHDDERPTPNAHRRTTSSPTGATEVDPDDDPRFWGAHPMGLLSPRRGHM